MPEWQPARIEYRRGRVPALAKILFLIIGGFIGYEFTEWFLDKHEPAAVQQAKQSATDTQTKPSAQAEKQADDVAKMVMAQITDANYITKIDNDRCEVQVSRRNWESTPLDNKRIYMEAIRRHFKNVNCRIVDNMSGDELASWSTFSGSSLD